MSIAFILIYLLYNKQCDDGLTPLMRAASIGGIESLRLLLYKKADPNLIDNDGCAAIHHACKEKGNSSVVRSRDTFHALRGG